MKILFVTDYFHPHIGGVEKLFEQLTTRLVANGHQVDYITWRYSNELPRYELHRGVNVIRIKAPTRALFPFFALRQIIKHSRNVAFIHTSTYSSAIGVWIAAKLTRKKTVLTVHEVWDQLWNDFPFLSRFEKHTFRLLEKSMLMLGFSHYIAVSESTRRNLIARNIAQEKITRIYNGIDLPLPQWTIPDTPFTFTYFGRTGVSKGLDLLIPAAKFIVANNPQIRFKFIVSPQDERVLSWLKSEVEKSPLKEACTFYQSITHKQLLLELLSSHCVVIPSYSEGFGFSAAEASAIGVPIISSGKGSLPEVVSGKIIEMSSFSVDALIDAMLRAINNEYQIVANKTFTVDNFVDEHLILYDKISR